MTPLLSLSLLATQTDKRLLTLAADGHDRAFEAIVERYRRPLARYLRRVLSGPLAEDVLQATFVNAWRSLGNGTEVRELRPWLYRIAHNQAVNALRRAEPQVQAEVDDATVAAAPTADPAAAAEQRDALRRALTAVGQLPDRQRLALVAIAVEGRPHTDVALELGLTEGALRQLVHRARCSLRAAATAIVPTPLVTAVASGDHGMAIARGTEIAAGAGGAGLGVKAGAALLTAGALVVATPVVHEQRAQLGARQAAVARATAPSSAHRAAAVPAPVVAAPHSALAGPDAHRGGGHGPRGSGGDDRRHRAANRHESSSGQSGRRLHSGFPHPGAGRTGRPAPSVPSAHKGSGHEAHSGSEPSAEPDRHSGSGADDSGHVETEPAGDNHRGGGADSGSGSGGAQPADTTTAPASGQSGKAPVVDPSAAPAASASPAATATTQPDAVPSGSGSGGPAAPPPPAP